ncbi:MAG: hypothetical protein HUU16_13745 [Candidatus Omnitrophica bacterium]|nr:hypothetical protein [Candidatus Omnitrophota bacterium]
MRKLLVLAAVLCLLSPNVVFAQPLDPVAAGVQTLSPNFDVWPDFLAFGNNRPNALGMAAIGKDPVTNREEFVVVGTAAINANGVDCGLRKVVVDRNGIVADLGGWIGDDGTTDITALTAGVQPAKLSQDVMVRGNRETGEFIIGACLRETPTWKLLLGANTPAALNYWNNASPASGSAGGKANFQRFDRDGNTICDMTPGRNVPSPDDLGGGDPNWVGGVSAKPAGVGILSDGNSFYSGCTRSSNANSNEIRVFIDPDRTAVDNVSNPFYGTANDDVTVHSITNPAATTYVLSTTAVFQTRKRPQVYWAPSAPGFWSPKSEASSSGDSDYANGWYGLYQDQMIAIYNNAGTLVAYATQTSPLNNPGGNNMPLPTGFENDTNRDTWFDREQNMACGGNRLARMCTLKHTASGFFRRGLMIWEVNTTAGTCLPVTRTIIVDDDLNGGAGPSTGAFSDAWRVGQAVDVDEQDGTTVVAYRDNSTRAVVCRVYNPDGTPKTPNFFVSGLPDPTTDNNSGTGYTGDSSILEVAISGDTICVCWTSDNAVPTISTAVDCTGVAKPLPQSQVARLFQLPSAIPPGTAVREWDLYD